MRERLFCRNAARGMRCRNAVKRKGLAERFQGGSRLGARSPPPPFISPPYFEQNFSSFFLFKFQMRP